MPTLTQRNTNDLVVGLISVKYISNTIAARRVELEKRFTDKAGEYYLPDSTAELLKAELEDRDYYTEVSVLRGAESACWEALPNIGMYFPPPADTWAHKSQIDNVPK